MMSKRAGLITLPHIAAVLVLVLATASVAVRQVHRRRSESIRQSRTETLSAALASAREADAKRIRLPVRPAGDTAAADEFIEVTRSEAGYRADWFVGETIVASAGSPR